MLPKLIDFDLIDCCVVLIKRLDRGRKEEMEADDQQRLISSGFGVFGISHHYSDFRTKVAVVDVDCNSGS